MQKPKIAPLVAFHATSTPLCAPCQTRSASIAAPRCDPTTCVTVLAISSPLDCTRAIFSPFRPMPGAREN